MAVMTGSRENVCGRTLVAVLCVLMGVCFTPVRAVAEDANDTADIPFSVTRAAQLKLVAEEVTFTTSDGVNIVGRWVKTPFVEGRAPAVALVPTMGTRMRVYGELARALAAHGWSALAFDPRGIGGSTKQGIRALDQRRFRLGGDFQAMSNDVQAALEFLAAREDVDSSKLAVVGEGLGANVTVLGIRQFWTTNPKKDGKPRVMGAALLSPGDRFKGVKCDVTDIAALGQLPLFLCASYEDRYSYETVDKYRGVKNLNPNLSVFFLENAGHGTEMFTANRYLIPQIVKWLREIEEIDDPSPEN